MQHHDRPGLQRAGTAQASGLSRSSRLDSLSSLAGASPISDTAPDSLPPSRSPNSQPWDIPHSRAPSPTSRQAYAMASGTSPTALALPSSSAPSPRLAYANSTSSSHSSTCTNTGFVVTSRPKPYSPPSPNPPPNAGTFGGTPAASTHSPYFPSSPPSASIPSTSPYPPPIPSGSGYLSAGFPPLLGARRGSSPAALPTASSTARSRNRSSADMSASQSPLNATAEPKTTLTLSSSIDSKGRRMVNQYVRLKTIGQGSHGKVWLCAEPTVRESDEEEGEADAGEGQSDEVPQERYVGEEGEEGQRRRRRRRTASERWEDDIDEGRVQYCAIKSVARDGPGKNKSLRMAKGRKASSQGSAGIGADDKVKREVAIMKRLDHPNIVRLKEVIDDTKSKKVFMVLEFMAGGQVVWQDENKQPTMSVDEARRTFRDVVLGLEYLHYQGIIHRDIKPANLLWTDDHSTVKISDFGVSHVSDALLRCSAVDPRACEGHDDDKALRKTAGSPAFFAPELCHPAELTPTPNAHASAQSLRADGEADAYFTYGPDSVYPAPSLSPVPSRGGDVYTPPTSPNGLALSTTLISRPLPSPAPDQPRTRPPVGKGIDVWALGVTLYCLLFGDTPFTARTEYELYNVIAREPVRVPQKMGVEGAWTGVAPAFEGCGDGAEGREVVDLLGKLLEKDPKKRITLEEVKTHAWVLRNLASPDTWLHTADPGRIDHVTITDEDVQHATQERGAVDTLPPIRNRPGIRRALNAALARFPAFSRIKSTRTTASTNSEEQPGDRERRVRSKSNSSTGQSATDGALASEATVSRQSSDGTKPHKPGKLSHEFGLELRRIISGTSNATIGGADATRSPSPAHGVRGGWGNRSGGRKSTLDSPVSPTSANSPAAFPELARSVSSNSVLGTSGGRSHFSHHLFNRKVSDNDPSRSAQSSTASSPSVARAGLSPCPWGGADTEAGTQSNTSTTGSRHRTISRMLSRLGGGGGSQSSQTRSRNPTQSRKFSDSTDDGSGEVYAVSTMGGGGVAPHVLEQFEAANEGVQYDALGRPIAKKKDSDAPDARSLASGLTAAKEELDAADGAGEDEDGPLDLTEFEYSESDEQETDDDDDDDDLDDFMRPALASGNHLSGWSRPDLADFSIGIRSPSEDDTAGGLYASSPTGTPPTDELDPLSENEPPRRKPSPPQPDTVSYAFVPLDYEFAPTPASPPRRIEPAHETSPRANAPLLSLNTGQQFDLHSRQASPAPSSPSTRDGSIRGVSLDPPRKGLAAAAALGNVWQRAQEADEEDDGEEEMLVVPRRRRAATLSGSGPAGGGGPA
ncbi:hypothetical protein JCM11641_000436 [Rhodosporidiobolus odoratus]